MTPRTSNLFTLTLSLQLVMFIFVTSGTNRAVVAHVATENSTAKIRIKPSITAKRIGTSINWQSDLAEAMKQSAESEKPIFWYVPTLSGSFMDRKTEIDRYMMAGPFSWPSTVNHLNRNFICVKTTPNRRLQQRYGLLPYEFIEPGFVVLRPSGDLDQKVDRITTFHPEWFQRVLERSGKKFQSLEKSPALTKSWEAFARKEYTGVETAMRSHLENTQLPDAETAEANLLLGMAMFRQGKHKAAQATWQSLAESLPDEPLAWKAAAEAENVGPFVRGFEVFTDIKADAYSTGPLKGTTAQPETFDETEIWSNGTQFLLGMQREDGGFHDSDYDFGGTDSLPNVRVAVTSLAGSALLQSLSRSPDNANSDAIKKAILGCHSFVRNAKNINTFDRDEILWAYAFRLRFMLQLKANLNRFDETDTVKSVDEDIRLAIKTLEGVQSKRGSWYHEYSNSFVTATALAALKQAEQAGFEVSSEKIERGIASLKNDRMGNGAYPYSSNSRVQKTPKPGNDRNIAASAGRMPLCEMGLYYWNQSNDKNLENAVERSIAFQENLNKALKYDDHTSNLAYGGFFFWYDMRARSEAISLISNAELKKQFATEQKRIILSLPEIDGCFVDSHELGRVYGTSMALLSLSYCE